MKQPILPPFLGCLLVALAGTVCTSSVLASAASDCRQEATDYEIPAEQLDDYVNGCLASRGEYLTEETTDMEMDYVPPEEPIEQEELLQEPITDDGDITY